MYVRESELKEERPLTAWEKRRSDASMRIEKSALELFLARGIEGVTVEEIAAAAGISRRTFYRYFDSPEDILAAMPRRSLQRISRDVRSRPMSESIPQAFVNAAHDARISPEEIEIQQICKQICDRWPDAWFRAMGRVHPNAADVFTEVVADRLHAAGKDPAPAALIGAVLSTVIIQVCIEADQRGEIGPDADMLEAALASLADIMSDAGSGAPGPQPDRKQQKTKGRRPK